MKPCSFNKQSNMKSISPGDSLKDYCRESSKDVPVSRLVSASDLCLQSWASLMQNLTGIWCFTWRKPNIFIKEILSWYFLRTPRLKPHKQLLKSAFCKKDFTSMYVDRNSKWKENIFRVLHLFKGYSVWKKENLVLSALRSSKDSIL